MARRLRNSFANPHADEMEPRLGWMKMSMIFAFLFLIGICMFIAGGILSSLLPLYLFGTLGFAVWWIIRALYHE